MKKNVFVRNLEKKDAKCGNHHMQDLAEEELGRIIEKSTKIEIKIKLATSESVKITENFE